MTPIRTVKLPAAIFLLGVLGACAVGADYRRETPRLSARFHGPEAELSQPSAPDETHAWWRSFGDPTLDMVVAAAAAGNLDLEAATGRLARARAEARAQGAALAPSFGADGHAAGVHQSLNGPIGSIGRAFPEFRRDVEDDAFGLSASWELDFFGGDRRRREAARADASAAAAQARAAHIAVEAEAADAYLALRGLQGRVAIAANTLSLEETLLELVRQRVREGAAPASDAHLAEASLEDVRASVGPLRAASAVARHRLEVLMGVQPGEGPAALAVGAALPIAPPPPAAGAPEDLLRIRPDVVAAEARLRAANAGVGVALAEYYPKVSLSALLGSESIRSGALFSPASQESQAALGLRWRLFDFGRIDAELAAARGARVEALAAWRMTILVAAEDVENALIAQAEGRTRTEALTRAQEALLAARADTQRAYGEGVVSLLDLRRADRDVLGASDRLLQSQSDLARATVRVFRALGRG